MFWEKRKWTLGPYDQEGAANLIKDLLSAPVEWYAHSMSGILTIKFKKVNEHKLQNDIADWLDVPQRKVNRKLLGGD